MSLITGIEAQPNFPKEDLTDDNAAILELLLSNRDLVGESHVISEQTSWIFKVGHRVIATVASGILEKDDRLEALDHGTTIFEAMSGLLTATPVNSSALFAVETQAAAWTQADAAQSADYQQEAYEAFHRDLPKAEEVVTIAAARFYPHFTGYALIGAAMARQFELDCIDA
jgi:hypothetical protein